MSDNLESTFKDLVKMSQEQIINSKDKQATPGITLRKKVKNIELSVNGKDIDSIISVLRTSEERIKNTL